MVDQDTGDDELSRGRDGKGFSSHCLVRLRTLGPMAPAPVCMTVTFLQTATIAGLARLSLLDSTSRSLHVSPPVYRNSDDDDPAICQWRCSAPVFVRAMFRQAWLDGRHQFHHHSQLISERSVLLHWNMIMTQISNSFRLPAVYYARPRMGQRINLYIPAPYDRFHYINEERSFEEKRPIKATESVMSCELLSILSVHLRMYTYTLVPHICISQG